MKWEKKAGKGKKGKAKNKRIDGRRKSSEGEDKKTLREWIKERKRKEKKGAIKLLLLYTWSCPDKHMGFIL